MSIKSVIGQGYSSCLVQKGKLSFSLVGETNKWKNKKTVPPIFLRINELDGLVLVRRNDG